MYITKVDSVLSELDISKEIYDKNTLAYYPKVQSSRVKSLKSQFCSFEPSIKKIFFFTFFKKFKIIKLFFSQAIEFYTSLKKRKCLQVSYLL